MWTRAELKSKAKIVMNQNYWKAVLAAIVTMIATGGFTSSSGYNLGSAGTDATTGSGYELARLGIIIGIIISVVLVTLAFALAIAIFVLYPLEVGCRRYFISSRTAPGDLSLLGFGFKNSYMNLVKTMFLRNLFIFLWSLLLFIPGIIKFYEYRMIPYLLAENPSLDSSQAFARSKEMMAGQKWNVFVLDLSFIGWHLLGLFTCFILNIFYVNPYQQSTNAELYEALK